MSGEIGFADELTCVHQVADLDRAIEWYAEALGFPLLFKVEEIGWCELQTHLPGVTIGLSEVEEPKHGGGAVLTFTVADVESARERLEGLGVRFDGPNQEVPSLVRLCSLYDIDGNAIMLAQDLRRGGEG
jgi:predicted enzyme related to lactoylglutathione lyase